MKNGEAARKSELRIVEHNQHGLQERKCLQVQPPKHPPNRKYTLANPRVKLASGRKGQREKTEEVRTDASGFKKKKSGKIARVH